jgi:hypothetical protein
MKKALFAAASVLLLVAGAGSRVTGQTTAPSADGLLRFVPPQAVSCVAVRVDVPEDKMITGLRWYNGTDTRSFAHILVASGNDFEPPAYSDAVSVADSVTGLNEAWSEVVFNVPVASQSGTLFVVLEYPPNYDPAPGEQVLGVGYANEASSRHYFVTGDGTSWYRVTSRCRVLLEPVLADRTPGVTEKRGGKGDDKASKLGLFASPNPFNPATRIDLYLPAATTGKVRIMDVRGYVVTELHSGALQQGQNAFVWKGRDEGDRAVASGVYWVLAETADQRLVRKVLLVK